MQAGAPWKRTGLVHIIKPLSGSGVSVCVCVWVCVFSFTLTLFSEETHTHIYTISIQYISERCSFLSMHIHRQKDMHSMRWDLILRIKCSIVQFLFLWHSPILLFHFFSFLFFQLRKPHSNSNTKESSLLYGINKIFLCK